MAYYLSCYYYDGYISQLFFLEAEKQWNSFTNEFGRKNVGNCSVFRMIIPIIIISWRFRFMEKKLIVDMDEAKRVVVI